MLGSLGEAAESGPAELSASGMGCLTIGTKLALPRSGQQLVLEIADPAHAEAPQHEVGDPAGADRADFFGGARPHFC
jgi:hypothetical protein